MKLYVINGANLNLLGMREPELYGKHTLTDINAEIAEKCRKVGCELIMFQSNHEGEIIDKIHEAYKKKATGIVINPGAFAHYSYAIRDAILAVKIPTIEVHLSNIYAREEFRQKSVIAEVCKGAICGLGLDSYLLAVESLIKERE